MDTFHGVIFATLVHYIHRDFLNLIVDSLAPRISSSRSRNTKTIVSVTPSSLIKIGETVNIIKGLPLRIKCQARGIPAPDISWELNRKPIKDDSIILTKDSVLILKFQEKHKGYYKCVAKNVLGQARAFSDVRIIGKIS